MKRIFITLLAALFIAALMPAQALAADPPIEIKDLYGNAVVCDLGQIAANSTQWINAKSALNINGRQYLDMFYMKDFSGMPPYTVYYKAENYKSVNVYSLDNGKWTLIYSQYDGKRVVTQIKTGTELAFVCTPYDNMSCILPRGTVYYDDIIWANDLPTPKSTAKSRSLGWATIVGLEKVYSNGYSVIIMDGKQYLIDTDGYFGDSVPKGSSENYTVVLPKGTRYYTPDTFNAMLPAGQAMTLSQATIVQMGKTNYGYTEFTMAGNKFLVSEDENTGSDKDRPDDVVYSAVGADRVTISWDKVAGADGYELQRSTDNRNFTLVKRLTGLKYTDTGLKSGTVYYYRVCAYEVNGDNKDKGPYSEVVSVRTAGTALKIAAVSGVKAGLSGKNVKITWTKTKNATAYEVYRSVDNKKFIPVGKAIKGTSFTDTRAKANRQYYYKVRAYSGNTKGTFSKVVNIKTN